MFRFNQLVHFFRNKDLCSLTLQHVSGVQRKFHQWQQPSKNGNHLLKIASAASGQLLKRAWHNVSLVLGIFDSK